MSLDSIDAVNSLVSNSKYNQNSEKEDRGTANTKKAEKYKGKGYFIKKVILWKEVYTYRISFIIYL